MDDDEEMICSICRRPILDGEGRYTAGEHKGIYRHWDCYKPELDKIDRMLKDLNSDIEKLGPIRKRRSPCRPGDGPVAKRLGLKIVAALKRQLELDVTIEHLDFWVQPPTYRGPRWDLAVWGCTVEHPAILGGKIMLHSWEPMTKLVKQETLTLYPEGVLTFDVG